MPVNPSSVIPTWLNNYNSGAYTALTNQENWSYVNQGTLNWQPLFQQLASAINAYQTYNRKSEIQNFMEGTYGYIANGVLYGTDTSLLPTFDGLTIYSMSGFLANTITRPVNWYSDLVAAIPPATGYTSAHMAADVSTVTGAPAAETTNIGNAANATHAFLHDMIYKLMFQDVPVQGVVNKQSQATTYFTTLHWTQVFNNLNVGGLAKPPGF